MRRSLTLGLSLVAAAVGGGALPAQAQVRFHGEIGGSADVKVMSWRDIPFRTVVRQQYDFSCGSAALATLLSYHYGRKTTEGQAFEAMFAVGDKEKIRKVGFSLLDMKRYLASQGIKSDGFRLTLDDLVKRSEPVIVLIDLGKYRHFIVVKGVAGDKILVGDPALGMKTYSRKEFAKIWNGIAFAIYPNKTLSKSVFNAANEWRPWSRAPLGDARLLDTTASAFSDLPLYQITPVTTLSMNAAGGG